MYKAYLVDLDGTIYRGKERIPEAEQFLDRLINNDIPFKLVTNNSTKTANEVAEDLQTNYSVPVSKQHIYTSTLALIDYLNLNHRSQNIYAIGETGLIKELESAGYAYHESKEIDVVVQGLNREVTFEQLTIATQAIITGAEFIVTNTDRLLPSGEGFIPSSGPITSFLHYATQKQPVVIGKPNKYIMRGALDRLGIPKENVLMIGDNYETDIMAGINSGLDTLLVLTGVTAEHEVPALPIKPTYVLESLADWELP